LALLPPGAFILLGVMIAAYKSPLAPLFQRGGQDRTDKNRREQDHL
jgi:hypothetical protein